MSRRTYQKNPKGKVNCGYKEREYCEYKEKIRNFNDKICRRHVPFDRQEIGMKYNTKATATLEPEPTQHNSLDRLQIKK